MGSNIDSSVVGFVGRSVGGFVGRSVVGFVGRSVCRGDVIKVVEVTDDPRSKNHYKSKLQKSFQPVRNSLKY